MFFVNASDDVFFYGGEHNLIAAHVATGKMVATSSRTFLSTLDKGRLESYSDSRYHLGVTVRDHGLGLLAVSLRLVDLLALVSYRAGLGWIFPLC